MNSLLNEIDSAWNRLAGESATNEIHMETLALILEEGVYCSVA